LAPGNARKIRRELSAHRLAGDAVLVSVL